MEKLRLSFLNCRSMKNKFENIKKDRSLLKSDLIILTETWLTEDQNLENYDLPHYDVNYNHGGRGKGIASYFTRKFTHKKNANEEGLSISMLEMEDIDVIGVYRSQEGSISQLIEKLDAMVDNTKTIVIGGDMNICVASSPNNQLTKYMREKGFAQLVKKATHIEGGIIDHIYIKFDYDCKYSWNLEDFPKYYSDHDSLGLTLWKQ